MPTLYEADLHGAKRRSATNMTDISNTIGLANAREESESPRNIRGGADAQSYLARLTRQRLLTAEEEVALAGRIQHGAKNDKDLKALKDAKDAKDELVEANMRLVVNVARTYHSSLIPFEDLVQEGAIGLITAAERFDASKGFRFSTYATHWIRQAITRAIDNKSKPIRLPAHVSEILRKIERARTLLMRETGEDPTAEQLAEYLNVPARKITSLISAGQEPVSLDMLVGSEENTTLASLLNDENAVDPQDMVLNAEKHSVLVSLLETLTPREQEIMRRRLGYEEDSSHVLQEIGTSMRISRERVRQIELQALRKLKFTAKRRGLSTYIND
jgi:RNA polymerase primary sigma factor